VVSYNLFFLLVFSILLHVDITATLAVARDSVERVVLERFKDGLHALFFGSLVLDFEGALPRFLGRMNLRR